ncbi:MAG: hypothetical protein ACRDKT_16665 [Actinomycetota bacterium]
MRVRAITLLIALVAALVPAGSVTAGTPAPGWIRAQLVHSFTQHDDDGWDLVTFNNRAYVAVAGQEDGFRRLYLKTNDTATGTFRSERVAEFPGDTVVRTVSIGVAPNGDVYIAYSLDPNVGPPATFLATDASSSWVSIPVPTTGDSGAIAAPEHPDLAILSDGSVAVAFQATQQSPCTGTGDIFVTTFSAGAFSTPTNVTHGNTDGTLCVFNTYPALAASGTTLHLAYRWVSNTGAGVQLHYRSGSLLNSTDETVDATATTIDGYSIREFGIDMVVDNDGIPHIGYVTENDTNVTSVSTRYATKSGTTWTLEEVQRVTEGRAVSGPSVSVAVDQAAVAYTVDGAGDDPGGSTQSQAFIAKRAGAGQPWAIDNLNRGSVDDVDPEIAAAAGRFHALFLEINGLGANPFSHVYQHEAPRPTIEFNLTGGKTFRGGEPVPMRGDIDPATVRERVVINTQRKKGARWVNVDKKRVRSNADGEWSFRHPALPTGRTYRARAEVRDTVDHRAGKNPWVRFEVQARRNH